MQGGFTLLEMVVTLVILGLAAVIVLPDRVGAGGAVELKAAARDLASGLRRTREAAITANSESVFTVDLARRAWSAADGKARPIPRAAELSVVTAKSEVVTAEIAHIRFFPEGGSTGGGVRLERGGQVYTVKVDWLTGRVEVAQ